MRPLALAALLWGLICPVAAGAQGADRKPDAEIMVPGATALLEAAGVRVPVEPERAFLVLVRHLHGGRSEPARIAALFENNGGSAERPQGAAERAPSLLPPAVWRRAVFGRDVPAEVVAASVLRDRQASFLYQGLFALDDGTLAFFAANPELVAALYQRSAAAFAAYSEGIRIREGRVQVPGGPDAERAWEAALGASPADPARFVPSLFERDGGRAAELFEALGRLDSPHLAFAIGPSGRDLPALILSAAAFNAYAHLPFASWSEVDVPFLLEQVQVRADGRMGPPREQAFWDAALAGRSFVGGAGGPGAANPSEVTAAWLIERFGRLTPALRRQRLDALLFAQRRAAGHETGDPADWLEVVASFPAWQALFLTLEQMQATDPADYRAAARAAAAVTAGHSGPDAWRRIGAFQSALALVARLEQVGTLDAPAALDLSRDLFGRAGLDRGRFAAGLADWVEGSLLARLGEAAAGTSAERRLIDALAGPQESGASRVVEWEGRRYVVDLAAAERCRLEVVREAQGGSTLDDVIARRHASPKRPGDPAGPLEALLADVLVAFVYALGADPDTPMVPDDGPWRRHDFGLGEPASSGPWRIADLKAGRGARGSLLALDRALARESLRPTMMGLPPRPPTLTLEDTTGLAESVVAMNPFRLTDAGRDLVAAAVARGRARLERAASHADALDQLLTAAGVDGIRRRLARLAAGESPSRVFEYVSLSEVLELGQDAARIPGSVLAAWGVAARPVDGSLGQWMPPRLAWRDRSGHPGSGLMAGSVADLHLRVVEWLADRRLPATLARAVLALATWDLAMTAQAANADDWLPVVRAAQAVSAERFEDYVSALAAGGPLIPDGSGP